MGVGDVADVGDRRARRAATEQTTLAEVVEGMWNISRRICFVCVRTISGVKSHFRV